MKTPQPGPSAPAPHRAAPVRAPGIAPLPALSLVLALALSVALGACGSDDSGPARYAVAQRAFTWTGEPPAEGRPPLSLAWDFAGHDPPGRWAPAPGSGGSESAGAAGAATSGAASPADGVLALTGRGSVELLGPGPGITDPQVHQWLTFRARTASAGSVTVQWRRQREDFSPSRRTSEMALDRGETYATYQVPLASLRGVREAADADEGVDEFRLHFRGASEDAPVTVEIDQIALVSDLDALDAHGVHAGRLDRLGTARDGIALRLPGAATLDVPAGDGDRLRFALALLGATAPVGVLVHEAQGRVPDQRFTLAPDATWVEHALALPRGDLLFTFSAPEATGSRAVLLVGSVLRLQRIIASGAPGAPGAPRASVVLYVEDTLRADHTSAGGYAHATDPHLTAIAAQGATFTRTWATSNWTRPSVSSILTSLDPVAHGNQVHTRRIPASLVTLAEALAEQGYVTASFVTNYHAGTWSGLDKGFDAQGDPRAFGAPEVTSTLTSNLIRDPIAQFLAEHADEQFFVFAHSLDPHVPYAPTSDDALAMLRDPTPRATLATGDRARFDEATLNYDAEVLHNDHALGALDETLRGTGLADRTLFVFASDHGEAFSDHGQWEHRQSLHEEELRVPWVLRLPGTVTAGARLDASASLVDLAPTLFGLLGLPSPAEWSGRDLSALCRGATATPAPPEARAPSPGPPQPLFVDAVYDEPPRADIRHEVAVIAWPLKLIATVDEHGACTPEALFDLAADPTERTDLLPRAEFRDPVAGMLDFARRRVARGPLHPAEGADAAGMDPALREWMVQLGYLR